MLLLPPSPSRGFAAGKSFGRKTCLWGSVLIACASLPMAQGQQEDSGPGRSPFLPQGWEQRSPTTAQRPVTADATESGYVFNGMIQIGSRTLFSIGNTQTGQAMLLEAGDNSGDIQIGTYDPQRNVVSLKGAGRTEELTLRKSDGEPLAAAPTGNAAPGGNRGGNMQGRQVNTAQGGAANRSGPPVEWLEARRNRLNEQIEMRRAQQAADSDGSVAVGVEAGGGTAGTNAAGGRQNGNVQRSGQTTDGSQSTQGTRPRRLRMEMNP